MRAVRILGWAIGTRALGAIGTWALGTVTTWTSERWKVVLVFGVKRLAEETLMITRVTIWVLMGLIAIWIILWPAIVAGWALTEEIAVGVLVLGLLLDRLRLGCLKEVMLVRISIEVVEHILGLPLAKIVLWLRFVAAKDLHSWRALDSILFGQITVGHNINGAESDILALETSIFSGSLDLRVKVLAVWAPVGVEGDHPGVLIVFSDLFSPILRVELLNAVEHGESLSGQHGQARCKGKEFHNCITV